MALDETILGFHQELSSRRICCSLLLSARVCTSLFYAITKAIPVPGMPYAQTSASSPTYTAVAQTLRQISKTHAKNKTTRQL